MKLMWLKQKGWKVEVPPRLILGVIALGVVAIRGPESFPMVSLILRAAAGGLGFGK